MKTKMRCGYMFEIEEDSVWFTVNGQRMRFLFGGEDELDKMTDDEVVGGVSLLQSRCNAFGGVSGAFSNWGM